MGEDHTYVARTCTDGVVLMALEEGLAVALKRVQGHDEDRAQEGAALKYAREDEDEELFVSEKKHPHWITLPRLEQYLPLGAGWR